MADGVPDGFITTNDAVPEQISNLDRIEVEDIRRLWQVFGSNKAALPEHVGSRLENFFWRVWSSDRLLRRLSGQQVAALFTVINDGETIRTTPRGSPRSSRSLPSPTSSIRNNTQSARHPDSSRRSKPSSKSKSSLSDQRGKQRDESSSAASSRPSQRPSAQRNLQSDDDGIATPTPSSPFTQQRAKVGPPNPSRDPVQPPPPILKKSGSASTRKPSKSTIVVSPSTSDYLDAVRSGKDDESAIADDGNPSQLDTQTRSGKPISPTSSRRPSARFEGEVTIIPESTASANTKSSERSEKRLSAELGQVSAGRRNPVVVAAGAASRRRPVLKQRSSYNSKTSPSPPSPSLSRKDSAGSTPSLGQSPSRQSKISQASPASANPQRLASQLQPLAEGVPHHSKSAEKGQVRQPQTGSLPSSNRMHSDAMGPTGPHRSFTNLSNLSSKSSAVTGTTSAFAASGQLDVSGNANEFEVGPSSPASRRRESDESDEFSTSGRDAGRAQLPRTKSQLSTLLEKSGKASAGSGSSKRPS